MKIEIDQSGKIEETNKPTVLAFSNMQSGSVIILAQDKKFLQNYFRTKSKPRMFIFFTFAVLINHLIRDLVLDHSMILIDQEYPGHEDIIKSLILEIFMAQEIKIEKEAISFQEIGKKSNAHILAIKAYRLKKADQKVTADDIIKVVSQLKKKNRVQFGYLNTV